MQFTLHKCTWCSYVDKVQYKNKSSKNPTSYKVYSTVFFKIKLYRNIHIKKKLLHSYSMYTGNK